MGGDRLLQLLLYGMAGLAAISWGIVVVRAWAPAARRRGGQWYFEAIFLLAVPVSTTLVAFYPTDGAVGGLFPTINRAVSYAVVVLLIIGLFHGSRSPRRNVGGLIVAVTFFYLALIASGIGGVVPSLPEPYWISPLIVLTFLLHGGYTYDWLLRTARWALRIVLLLSVASIFVFGDLAFNTEESRQLFGISRLQGVAGHPNGLAAIAVLCLLLELLGGSKWVWKALSVSCLLLAQSSTGFVVAIVALLLLDTRLGHKFRWVLWVGVVVVAAGFLLLPSLVAPILEALAPAQVGTLTGRTQIWEAAMQGFHEGPIWGYGPELLGNYFRAQYLPGFNAAAQAHNQFVQTIAGSGLVGLTSLIVLAVVLLIYAIRSYGKTGGLSLALLALLVLRCVTETPLRPVGVSFTTMMLVVVFGLIAIGASEAKTASIVAIPQHEGVDDPASLVGRSGPRFQIRLTKQQPSGPSSSSGSCS
jgi:exopolysaccharide production protein ExoQ